MNTHIHPSPNCQQGAVLFVALVFLVLITLLGLTASSTSIMQERMTGGLRNGQLGLMAAETAARGAEAWLWNLSSNSGKINCGYNGGANGFCYASQTVDDGSGNTVYTSNPLVAAFRTTPTWIANASSGGKDYSNGSNTTLNSTAWGTARLAQVPQYMLESRGLVLPPGAPSNGQIGAQGRDTQPGRNAGNQALYSYRITSRATGGNEGAVRVVETTFGTGVPSN
jgi:type IV pilus assembly protein PilX